MNPTKPYEDDELEPTEAELAEEAVHQHACGNCGADFPCTQHECIEPFLCAECFLTEGENLAD